jgi:hypothetical protein
MLYSQNRNAEQRTFTLTVNTLLCSVFVLSVVFGNVKPSNAADPGTSIKFDRIERKSIGRVGTNMLCLTPQSITTYNRFFRFPEVELESRLIAASARYWPNSKVLADVSEISIRACYPKFGLYDKATVKGRVLIVVDWTVLNSLVPAYPQKYQTSGEAIQEKSNSISIEEMILSAFDQSVLNACKKSLPKCGD